MKSPIIIIGPSGAGKSSLTKEFLHNSKNRLNYSLIKTYTTRAMRNDEIDTHIFVDKINFSQVEFIDTIHLFGASYGLPKFQTDKIPIFILRVFAIDLVKKHFTNFKIIQIEASTKTILWRLKNRNDDRAITAHDLLREVELGRKYADKILVNNSDIGSALRELQEVIDDISNNS